MKYKNGRRPLVNASPCPHCGERILYEEMEFHEGNRRGVHYVICPTCKAKGGYGGDLLEAMQKWNLRTISDYKKILDI
jgi:Lar family restriction alleviation protein